MLSEPANLIIALSPLSWTVKSYVVLVLVFIAAISPPALIVILLPAVNAATTFVVSVIVALAGGTVILSVPSVTTLVVVLTSIPVSFVLSADQNIAAYNRSLFLTMK